MDSLAYAKSKRFAIRIIKLYTYLCEKYRDYTLFRQILRCGTSVGANLAEAECAISRADFLSKVYIALKETKETIYWLEILHETGYLTKQQFSSLHQDAEELRRMLSSTTKTMQDRDA